MNRSSKSHAVDWTLGAIAALVLYVLSIGPVLGWLYANGRNFTDLPAWLTTIYAPLGYAYERNQPLRNLLDDYRYWWTHIFM
jgi:hypothetical protein